MDKTKKLQEKSYRLADDQSGLTFMLKTGRNGRLLYFDKSTDKKTGVETGRNRAIRHCPNEKSIFIDEQSEFAYVDPITFITGYLDVPATEQMTQKFLDHHPDNVSNGGHWFEEVNDELEAKESIEIEEMVMDIKQAVRDKLKEEDGIYALEAVVAVLTGSVVEAGQMGREELKRAIYQSVDTNPFYFVNDSGDVTIFEDGYIFRKHIVLKGLNEGVIRKSSNGKSILWGKDKKLIATSPTSVDTIDFFADFLTTDEGILVLEEIKRRS